ncbi:MAG TPA: ABC transporter ATP-binding protein, partial [Actinomycetota bacterium]|nr:ABC transporter ATP-binding protein [Actinomycetota bacterium]
MTDLLVRSAGLTKRYGTTAVLDQVDLEVPEGSVYGLVGPNGAGKTTLLSILAGLRTLSSGAVHIAVDLSEVAVCPDAPEFEPWLTAAEVLALSASLAHRSLQPEAIQALLVQAGLGEAAARRVGGFSRGMTQRLALAATLAGDPKLIILDEPCSALDPAGRVEVLDLITRLAARATVIFSSHILADVQRVCTSVGVLRQGRLLLPGRAAGAAGRARGTPLDRPHPRAGGGGDRFARRRGMGEGGDRPRWRQAADRGGQPGRGRGAPRRGTRPG